MSTKQTIQNLVADIALATTKTDYWVAEAKRRQNEFGLTSPCYKEAAKYRSLWSTSLEELQEELELLADEEDLEFNTEYAKVD